MRAIKSNINIRAEPYVSNYRAMAAGIEKLEAELARSTLGGGEKYVKRHRSRGKLLPRERIELLLDDGSYFLVIAPLAGVGIQDEFVGAGVVGRVGDVSVRDCLFVPH